MKPLFKTILLLFLNFLFFNCAFSQTYVPFDTANAVWRAQRGYLTMVFPSGNYEFHDVNYNLVTLGDTLVNGNIYYKLYESAHDDYVAVPIPTYMGDTTWFMQYAGAYRENNSKHIYYVSPYDTTEYLLYDFNLSLGDTLQETYLTQSDFNYISKVDSIFDGTVYRKRFTISTDTVNPMNYNYASLIEGIGSSTGLLWYLHPPFESGGVLYCYKVNNIVKYTDSVNAICSLVGIETLLSSSNNFKLFPNPSSGIFQITFPSSSNPKTNYMLEVINTLGQTVFTSPPAPLQRRGESSALPLDLSFLPKGIYVLKINDGDNISSKIFIIG